MGWHHSGRHPPGRILTYPLSASQLCCRHWLVGSSRSLLLSVGIRMGRPACAFLCSANHMPQQRDRGLSSCVVCRTECALPVLLLPASAQTPCIIHTGINSGCHCQFFELHAELVLLPTTTNAQPLSCQTASHQGIC